MNRTQKKTLVLLLGILVGLGILLAVVVFLCLQMGPLKKLHPIVFIAASAVVGVVFRFAGV